MIFEILRSKMYSNPIGSICREISCNSRDAHRESGKANVPIEIYLPSSFNPTIKFRDFGPGISPDRIQNVYIAYAASTKRDDNTQTGGFGLGAKTPFAYTDTFSVVTRVDGVEYSYACYIDETKIGKVALISETPTDSPNGTDINIPVKKNDFSIFIEEVHRYTQYWDVKPNVFGAKFEYQKLDKVVDNKNWFITQEHAYNTINVLLDGIKYVADLREIFNDRMSSDFEAFYRAVSNNKYNINLIMNVGDISVSSNRESIHFTDKTKSFIIQRLLNFKDDFQASFDKKIKEFETLKEAKNFYDRNKLFVRDRIWKGIDLNFSNRLSSYENPTEASSFLIYKNIGREKKRLPYYGNSTIDFDTKTHIIVDDLNYDFMIGQLIPLIDNFKGVDKIQIIRNRQYDSAFLDNLIENHYLDKIGYSLLSEFLKVPAKRDIKQLMVYKYNGAGFFRTSVSNVKNSKNPVLGMSTVWKSGDHKRWLVSEEYNVNKSILDYLHDYDIYIVSANSDPEKVKEIFSNAIKFDDLIKERIKDEIDYEALYFYENKSSLSIYNIEPFINTSFYEKINDKSSIAGEFCKKIVHYKDYCKNNYDFINFKRLFNYDKDAGEKYNNEYIKASDACQLMVKTFLEKYKMISHTKKSYLIDTVGVDDIIDYINLVDKGDKNGS